MVPPIASKRDSTWALAIDVDSIPYSFHGSTLLGTPFFLRDGQDFGWTFRYADTAGYEGDPDLPHAWRYRDYVIDAFNSDKPYDPMTSVVASPCTWKTRFLFRWSIFLQR